MRVITVRQPWASLIAAGEKTVENRRWATSYRGPVAIHAGLEADDAAYRNCDVRDTMLELGLTREKGALPTGVVLAVADLVDCHATEGMCCVPWGETSGVQHLLLERIRPLRDPLPRKGMLGLVELDPGAESDVRARL